MMMLQVVKKQIVDNDAVEIGRLFAEGEADRIEASKRIVSAVLKHLKCGRRLNAKKESLQHGQWLDWLTDNCDILDFASQGPNRARNTERRAQRLMKAWEANPSPASDMGVEQALEISRQMWGHDKGSIYANCTDDYEWFTPSEIIERAREVMGSIDIDPASCAQANKAVKATKYFTKKDDGLNQEWRGNVFINPPFAYPTVEQFAEKLIESFLSRVTRQAIWLSNASVGSAWWNGLVHKGLVCFPYKRIKFYKSERETTETSQLGQSIVYMGERYGPFIEGFSEMGWVVGTVSSD